MNVVYITTVGVLGVVVSTNGNRMVTVYYVNDDIEFTTRFHEDALEYITEDDLV